MRKRAQGWACVGTILAACLFPGELSAAPAAALLVEKSGVMTPDLAPFSEIPVGTDLVLARTASVEFLHYRTCRKVSLTGGRVRFSGSSFQVLAGDPEVSSVPCPQRHTVVYHGELAGVRVRGAFAVVTEGASSEAPSEPVSLPPRPSFVLVGKRAADFSLVRISKEDKPLLSIPLHGPAVAWPSAADSLVPGNQYDMSFMSNVTDATSISVRFTVRAAQAGKGEDGLMVVDLGD